VSAISFAPLVSLASSVSLDSLIVSTAMALRWTPPVRYRDLCIGFAICDGMATLAGSSIHGPFAPVLAGVYIMLLAMVVLRSSGRSTLSVPALCSLDNLLAGMTGSAVPWRDVFFNSVTAAVVSGALALMGVTIAAALLGRVSGRWAPSARS
jgi:hypothetical protein